MGTTLVPFIWLVSSVGRARGCGAGESDEEKEVKIMAEYFEREAAIKAVMAAKWVDGSDGAMAMEIVATMPTTDMAPVVHSYWEHKITGSGENIGICHNCKYPVNWFWKRTKYCPNCGAKMDGSADREID